MKSSDLRFKMALDVRVGMPAPAGECRPQISACLLGVDRQYRLGAVDGMLETDRIDELRIDVEDVPITAAVDHFPEVATESRNERLN